MTTTSISVSTYLEFVASTMAAMVSTLRWLGDERVNQRPRLPGANSPYAIVVHCCGVMEWWGGHVIAGRPVSRDREAEFRATGTVRAAEQLLHTQHQRLLADLRALQPDQPPRGGVPPGGEYGKRQPSQGHAAMHIYEELAQHKGHLDLTRDLLMAAA